MLQSTKGNEPRSSQKTEGKTRGWDANGRTEKTDLRPSNRRGATIRGNGPPSTLGSREIQGGRGMGGVHLVAGRTHVEVPDPCHVADVRACQEAFQDAIPSV